jgi:hypothetical protein
MVSAWAFYAFGDGLTGADEHEMGSACYATVARVPACDVARAADVEAADSGHAATAPARGFIRALPGSNTAWRCAAQMFSTPAKPAPPTGSAPATAAPCCAEFSICVDPPRQPQAAEVASVPAQEPLGPAWREHDEQHALEDHGVFVGIAPAQTKRDTCMAWDEPHAAMLQCTRRGAFLWSGTANEYGRALVGPCLVQSAAGDGAASGTWHARVRAEWGPAVDGQIPLRFTTLRAEAGAWAPIGSVEVNVPAPTMAESGESHSPIVPFVTFSTTGGAGRVSLV